MGQPRRPRSQPPAPREGMRPADRRIAHRPETNAGSSTKRWSSGAASSAAPRPSNCRLPGSNAGKINGRDHNHYGFTLWLAGGGVKKGHIHGATDEFGFKAVVDPVHPHDLHATILHLLGFDHETLHLPLRRSRLPPHRLRRRQGDRGSYCVSNPKGGQCFQPVPQPRPPAFTQRSVRAHKQVEDRLEALFPVAYSPRNC